MTAPTLSSTLNERLQADGHNSERAALQLQLDTILAIHDQTAILRAALVTLVTDSQSQNNLLSGQLDGIREQLQDIRTDLQANSLWHKMWSGIRRVLFACPVVTL